MSDEKNSNNEVRENLLDENELQNDTAEENTAENSVNESETDNAETGVDEPETAETAEQDEAAEEETLPEETKPETANSKKKTVIIAAVCAAALVVVIVALVLALGGKGKGESGGANGGNGTSSGVLSGSGSNGSSDSESNGSNGENGGSNSSSKSSSKGGKTDSKNSENSNGSEGGSSSSSAAPVTKEESKKLVEKSKKVAVEYSSEYNTGDMASFTKKTVYSYQAVMPAATGLYKSEDDYYAKTYSCKNKADYCKMYQQYHKSLIQSRFGSGYKAEPSVKSVKTLSAEELGYVKDYINAFFTACGLKASDYVKVGDIKQIDIVECNVKLSGKSDSVDKTEVYAIFTIGNKQKIFTSNDTDSVNSCMKVISSLPQKQAEMQALAAGSLKTQSTFNKYFYVFN